MARRSRGIRAFLFRLLVCWCFRGLFLGIPRPLTNHEISCFYFEAFDEPWKDPTGNSNGSENHFGLFTVEGKAKYALWDSVDNGVFKGLTRNGNLIEKTYNGSRKNLLKDVLIPKLIKSKLEISENN